MNCIYNGMPLSYKTGDALYSVGYMLYIQYIQNIYI